MDDDYPGAAARHLRDGSLLLEKGRYDNAFYLLGYVVECSLKTIVEKGGRDPLPLKHDLGRLSAEYFNLVLLLSPGLRRYWRIVQMGVDDTTNLGWDTAVRYRRSGGTSNETAGKALRSAKSVFKGIVVQMRLDGKI